MNFYYWTCSYFKGGDNDVKTTCALYLGNLQNIGMHDKNVTFQFVCIYLHNIHKYIICLLFIYIIYKKNLCYILQYILMDDYAIKILIYTGIRQLL